MFDNGRSLRVDTIRSIVSNKLCACVSRTEPKDFIDLYMISKYFPDIRFETVYSGAQAKDAIFDDPPTAAYQLEQGFAFLQENRKIFPHIRISLDEQEFFEYYHTLIQWMYARVHISAERRFPHECAPHEELLAGLQPGNFGKNSSTQV